MTTKEAAIHVLHDALGYLNAINQALYTQPIALLSGSTIGQHTRHFVEFFLCLLEQSKDQGAINYDLRRRDIQIETDPAFTAVLIQRIIGQLDDIPWHQNTQIEACYNLHQSQNIVLHTSLERELMYNVEHTIHHLALVKIGLRLVAPDIEVPEHFGVAVSTIKYQQSLEKGRSGAFVEED